MLKRLWLPLFTAVLLAANGVADEAITLKVKKPGKGELVKETKTEVVNTVATVTAGGQSQEQKEKGGSKQVYTEEVVLRGDKAGKPLKVIRTYETAELTARGETVDLGLKGKTVTIEKMDGKYTFTPDDGRLSEEAIELLNKEFNKSPDVDLEQLMLPEKPVKVGDTWEVDSKAVAALFGDDLVADKEKTKVTAKLMKLYDKDKSKFGVIEYVVVMPITSINVMGQSVATSDASKLKLTVTMDACIDGTVYGGSSSGKMEGNVGLSVPGAEIALELSGTLSSTSKLISK